MTLFRGINFENLKDGEYIQFFGVHMLSWGDIERATGIKPTIAFIEDDTLEKQNADLVTALEKIANPPISPPNDKADRSVDIAQQVLARAKEKSK